MHISRRSRRVAGLLTALGAVLVTFASTGTAALATTNAPRPAGSAVYDPYPPPSVVVVGGTPGWQIALIAIGAALVAALVAVLAYRAWIARRQPLVAPRFGSPAQVAGGK
jgi:Zn-dependent protease with chaperone function